VELDIWNMIDVLAAACKFYKETFRQPNFVCLPRSYYRKLKTNFIATVNYSPFEYFEKEIYINTSCGKVRVYFYDGDKILVGIE
jgi:hypothetical protein